MPLPSLETPHAAATPAGAPLSDSPEKRLENSFAAHFAQQQNSGLPDWWLEVRQKAWEQFAALPLPTRLDERWRFSKLSGLALEGYTLPKGAANTYPHADYQCPTLPPFERAATLCFHGQTMVHGTELPAELSARGVIFAPLPIALAEHGDLLRDYFPPSSAAKSSPHSTPH